MEVFSSPVVIVKRESLSVEFHVELAGELGLRITVIGYGINRRKRAADCGWRFERV